MPQIENLGALIILELHLRPICVIRLAPEMRRSRRRLLVAGDDRVETGSLLGTIAIAGQGPAFNVFHKANSLV